MPRVTGIGGIFFKSKDPKVLRAWYKEHLGIDDTGGGFIFPWRENDAPDKEGMTVWSIHKAETKYFDPGRAPFMINYRVANLDETLAALRAEGVQVDEKVEDTPYGKFGWAM